MGPKKQDKTSKGSEKNTGVQDDDTAKTVSKSSKKNPPKDNAASAQSTSLPANSSTNKTGLYVSLYYLIVILGCGLPVWYKTTTPVRHSLPDISSLMVHSQMMAHRVHVTVVAVEEIDFDDDQRGQLRQQLTSNWPRGRTSDGAYAFDFRWKVRPALREEALIFTQNSNLVDVDNKLSAFEPHSTQKKLKVYLMGKSSLTATDERSVWLGTTRFVYILNAAQEDAESSLGETIMNTIGLLLEPNRPTVNDVSGFSVDIDGPPVTPKLLLDPEIDVFVNLALEDIEDAKRVQSEVIPEIQEIVNKAFLAQSGIQELLNIKVTTQMVYYALDSSQFVTVDNQTRHLLKTNIPSVLNSIESRIVEPNNKQSYNLHLIIPKSLSPLYFYDSPTGKTSTALLSSHSGGSLILNQPDTFNVAFKLFMRSLIGLPPVPTQDNLIRKNLYFTKWELDFVMRSISQNQVLQTLSSLESIEKLLGKVGNIVIEEEISDKMRSATKWSHESIDNLAAGYLSEAFELSTRAYVASEAAFFDQSLLELLYFPDDQKYAVYFPLFLPVSLPLITSLYNLLKQVTKK